MKEHIPSNYLVLEKKGGGSDSHQIFGISVLKMFGWAFPVSFDLSWLETWMCVTAEEFLNLK